MTASNKTKINPKTDTTKPFTRSNAKTSQLVDAQQPNTPSKDDTMAVIITPQKTTVK